MTILWGEYLSQFNLGDFVVDTDRCQIQRDDDSISIEPKVMDTLSYLSKHPGKVVSQKELFSAVWPEAIYNPSSIQRCIALLRKALKEDAKDPKALITHPKRGYSLELPVEYLPINNSSSNNFVGSNKLSNKVLLLAGIVSFILVAYLLFNMNKEIVIKEQYSELIPIVSTGKNELFPRYSPDGQYLAYIAHVADEKYHIWIKNLESSKVRRLSASASNFVSINWTHDQHAVSFVERLSFGDRMGRLPFNRYQSEPVAAQVLLSLKNEHIISQLQWTKNGEVIFVTKDKNQLTRLLHYANEMNLKTVLLAEEQATDIFDIALSNDNKVLALISAAKHNRYPITLFNLDTSQIRPLALFNGNVNGLNWHPTDTSLLVSNRAKLKLVDLSGEISDLNFTNYLNVANASYSPDGNKITMTLVSMDFDILVSSTNDSSINRRVIDSNSIDMQPLFSPDSSKFSFVSLRSGSQQVFIYKDGTERLLFKNSENKEFFGMAWSPDGQHIAITMEDTVYIVNVENDVVERTIKHGLPSMYLRGWYHHDNALLVNLPGPVAAKFDLDSLTLTQLSERTSHCTALDLDDNVYFNQTSRIVKLTSDGVKSIFWQSDDADIDHLFVNDDGLLLELEKPQENPFLKINFDKTTSAKHLALQAGKNWLADVSSDGNQLLFMTRSNINKTIFTLH